MEAASLCIDPSFVIGEIDDRIRGSFVEHLGRCVYGGIYEPGHERADGAGFREDVLDLVRGLRVPVVRYPGGNFVSGYKWEDGVGPVGERPRRLDLAWRSTEPNTVGMAEFAAWCAEARTEMMLAINLGTRGVDAARNVVEYANHPSGSYWSDLRAAHGARQPYDVKLWCLGNEMDGPWQIGHKTAAEYGRLASEAARAMRMVDPRIELVACGSSHSGMPTFPEWEATVLDLAYDDVDYLSLHSYYGRPYDDPADFLASALDMDGFIDSVVATCDYVRARKRRSKRMHLSFDEWNVWHRDADAQGPAAPWATAPALLENVYDVRDAVVVGSLINSLIRHADRVKIACLAQLVNVIAPIMTSNGGGAWRQTTYYPLLGAAHFARGAALQLETSGPSFDSATFGPVPMLDAAATTDGDGTFSLFLVNRDQAETLALDVDVRAVGPCEVVVHESLDPAGDPSATNTEAAADRVVTKQHTGAEVSRGHLAVSLAPLSWNVLQLRAARR